MRGVGEVCSKRKRDAGTGGFDSPFAARSSISSSRQFHQIVDESPHEPEQIAKIIVGPLARIRAASRKRAASSAWVKVLPSRVRKAWLTRRSEGFGLRSFKPIIVAQASPPVD